MKFCKMVHILMGLPFIHGCFHLTEIQNTNLFLKVAKFGASSQTRHSAGYRVRKMV
jgi:hypothetical protein